MKYAKLAALALMALNLVSCSNTQESIGDKSIAVFENEKLNFNPEKNKTITTDKVIKIDNGRIILTKVNLPEYNKHVEVSVNAELTSAGDPWDKTGSLFLIPSDSELNFLLENEDFNNLFDITNEDLFPGVVSEKNYKPAVEILRFMTPFGVGHYSNDPKLAKRKPVYIPKWEEKVVWNQDVTQLLNELEGEVWIAAFVDVWTKEGYELSVKLNYTESKAVDYPKQDTKVIPLVNTTRYVGPQRLYDEFSRTNLTCEFEIDSDYKKAELYYITTGHGGHSGGDEFVEKRNIVKLDSKELYNDIPWRDDCASFRRFNPHSGVWTEQRIAKTGNLKTGDTKEEMIDEFIASSDYSRSNWCPGSKVEPFVLELDGISKGKHQLEISIPEAQEEKENEMNHWNVSAYLVLTK